jgi:hypothetical protein
MQRSICENLFWFLVIEHQTRQLHEIASDVKHDSASELLIDYSLLPFPVKTPSEMSSHASYRANAAVQQRSLHLLVNWKESRPNPLKKIF